MSDRRPRQSIEDGGAAGVSGRGDDRAGGLAQPLTLTSAYGLVLAQSASSTAATSPAFRRNKYVGIRGLVGRVGQIPTRGRPPRCLIPVAAARVWELGSSRSRSARRRLGRVDGVQHTNGLLVQPQMAIMTGHNLWIVNEGGNSSPNWTQTQGALNRTVS